MDRCSASTVRCASRMPRASEDGPDNSTVGVLARTAAPRERGWTLHRHRAQVVAVGCPARAGMDQACVVGADSVSRLPRASGDGPQGTKMLMQSFSAAPRERGWTRHGRRSGVHDRGCPARAWMDPGRHLPRSRNIWLPRASGDGPSTPSVQAIWAEAAPRQRGWTLPAWRLHPRRSGYPTQTEMASPSIKRRWPFFNKRLHAFFPLVAADQYREGFNAEAA